LMLSAFHTVTHIQYPEIEKMRVGLDSLTLARLDSHKKKKVPS
jgi:hypothetical protein